MSRAKRKSPVLEMAQRRLAGLQTLDPKPDFGPALSLADYEAEITAVSTELHGYNIDVVALDNRQNHFESLEDSLQDKNRRMLSAVEAIYGPDSPEFEAAGGKRLSKHKRRTRKPASKGSPTT